MPYTGGTYSSRVRVCHYFQNAVTPEIMVGIASYLVHRGTLGRPFEFSTFDLGVTSRDLSMTLTVKIAVSGH